MEDLEFLSNGSILVDTCFLIDSGAWPRRFAGFIQKLKEMEVSKLSIPYLLTKNHADFPERLFERKAIIHFELPKALWTYAFYRYKSVSQ